MELIFATLKKAGFITSARGSQGGYQLIRPIESITIYEIIQLMENDTCIVSKQDETDPMKKMLMREVWTPIDDSLKLDHCGIVLIVNDITHCILLEKKIIFR